MEFVFLLRTVSIVFFWFLLSEMFSCRGRHDDRVGADSHCPRCRGADRARQMSDEARGKSETHHRQSNQMMVYPHTESYIYKLLFLFFTQNIYMTLLTLSFTSLSWKDTTNCHRTASMVCWSLLRQVVHSGSI